MVIEAKKVAPKFRIFIACQLFLSTTQYNRWVNKKPESLCRYRLRRATAKTRLHPEPLDDFRFRKKNEIDFRPFSWNLRHET